MDYASFKTYLTTFLWRQNDADLSSNLDNIIKMGEHELSRRLDIDDNRRLATLVVEGQEVTLPTDFRHVISLTNNEITHNPVDATLNQAPLSRVISERTLRSGYSPVYNISRGTLYLVNQYSADNPGSLSLVYRADVPDFAAENASFLADKYLDVYTYTVLSHTPMFLREDERVALWEQKKEALITSLVGEDKWNNQFGGSPLEMQPHHPVPRKRR